MTMFPRKYLLVCGLLVLCIFAYVRQASGDDDEKAKKGPKVTDKVGFNLFIDLPRLLMLLLL